MLTLDWTAMGCQARACLDDDSEAASRALEALPAWVERHERALSRFDASSALSRLNATGNATDADAILWEALSVALRVADETGGLVTPTVLRALESIGYDRTFTALPRELAALATSPQPAPWHGSVARDLELRSVRLPPGVGLDLGGTAKGWLADQVVARMSAWGASLVDFGGDVAVAGEEPWPIAVADPRRDGEDLELLLVARGGVATSGRDVRRWRQGGAPRHHVIDPRTGLSARTDVWSVTVVAPSALEAEVAAKLVMLRGAAPGLAWIDRDTSFAALLVRDDGEVLRSSRFARHAWKEQDAA